MIKKYEYDQPEKMAMIMVPFSRSHFAAMLKSAMGRKKIIEVKLIVV